MAAHHFISARLSGAHITDPAALPEVESLDAAYGAFSIALHPAAPSSVPEPFARAEIQKAMVSIGPQTAMGPHIGWKAGGTNAAAQKTLGLSGPFRERSALFFAARKPGA